SREGARTSTPRLGRKTTSPSASSRRSASRIGVRLTPYCSASCSWRSIVPGGSSPNRIARSRAAPISSALVVSASSIARISAISDPGYPNPPFLWATLVWLGSESRPWHRGGSSHEDSHDRDPNWPCRRDEATSGAGHRDGGGCGGACQLRRRWQ